MSLARARKSEICRDKEERQGKEKNTSAVPNRHIDTRCTQRCDVIEIMFVVLKHYVTNMRISCMSVHMREYVSQ